MEKRAESGNTYSSSKNWQEDLVIKPHELQQLAMSQVVSIYRKIAWIGVAEPFYVSEANELKCENDADMDIKIAKNTVVTKATIDKAVELSENKPKEFENYKITQVVADNLK